jgi:hypothetical protein
MPTALGSSWTPESAYISKSPKNGQKLTIGKFKAGKELGSALELGKDRSKQEIVVRCGQRQAQI